MEVCAIICRSLILPGRYGRQIDMVSPECGELEFGVPGMPTITRTMVSVRRSLENQ